MLHYAPPFDLSSAEFSPVACGSTPLASLCWLRLPLPKLSGFRAHRSELPETWSGTAPLGGASPRQMAGCWPFAVPTSLAAAGGCEPMGVDRGGAQAEATGCFITTDREITCSPLLAVLAMQELPDRLGNLIGSGRRTLGWHQLVRIDLDGGGVGGGCCCCWWWLVMVVVDLDLDLDLCVLFWCVDVGVVLCCGGWRCWWCWCCCY